MSDKEKGVVGKVISNISKPLAKRRGRGHGGQSGAGTSSSYDNDKSGSEMSRQLKRQPTHPMHMAKQSAHLSGEREKLEEQLGGESIYSDEEIKEDEQPVFYLINFITNYLIRCYNQLCLMEQKKRIQELFI